jgi:hypothetical protein
MESLRFIFSAALPRGLDMSYSLNTEAALRWSLFDIEGAGK